MRNRLILTTLSSTIAVLLFAATPVQAATIDVPPLVVSSQHLLSGPQELLSATGIPDPTIGLCSCVKYARTLIPALPMIRTPRDLSANTSAALGVAVLLDYNLAHIAVLTRIEGNGFFISESNFKFCQKTERFITFTDPALRGFWKPVDNYR